MLNMIWNCKSTHRWNYKITNSNFPELAYIVSKLNGIFYDLSRGYISDANS